MTYGVKFIFRSASLLLALVLIGCNTLPGTQGDAFVESRDGSRIVYGVRGEGDTTLVFVHCWTCSHHLWQAQIDHFSADYRVVWLDLAGHGQSSSMRNHYTMQAFGEDVAAVVNRVGGDRVVLVGHSMGGPVILEAADLLGDKVVGVVGVDTFYTPFEYPNSPEQIEGFVKPFKEDFEGASQKMVRSMFVPDADPSRIESIAAEFAGADQQMGVSAMYEIFAWNASQGKGLLKKYAAKLHNINGGGAQENKPLHESVVLIPGVGHFVPQMKPDEFNKALAQIISAI